MRLTYCYGLLGIVEAATSCYPGFPQEIKISGAKGSAVLQEDRIIFWKFLKERPDDEDVLKQFAVSDGSGRASDPSALDYKNHAAQISDFIDAIEKDRKPLVDGVEGRRSLQLVLAIYTSAAQGKSVLLD